MRRIVAAAVVAAVSVAGASAQTADSGRFALETVAAADASVWSEVTRKPGVWFDVFAAVRIFEGFDVIARPLVNRRTFDGTWQKQMYQLGVRYERPGRVGLRVDVGQMPSPIGIGMLENRQDLNPVISQHSAYYLPLPRVDPEIPRTFLIAAAYPLGAQATVSARGWDARAAVLDSSPVRGRPFFGRNKPPRLLNSVVGFGVTPHIGVRIGAGLAHGAYVGRTELIDTTTGDRDATMVQLEAEWSFSGTRLAGEWVHSVMETARKDAVASGGWIEATQTLTPRWFVAGRADSQQFHFQRPSLVTGTEKYKRFEAIAGFRLSPDLTLRGGYLVRKGYVVAHWDDQMVVSVVWQKKLL
jgi:hypothetical protein